MRYVQLPGFSLKGILAIILFVTLIASFFPVRPVHGQQQYPPPVINSITPSTIEAGKVSEITISGNYFLDGAKISVYPGTGITLAKFKWVNPGSIIIAVSVDSSATAGSKDITIVNPDKQSYTAKGILSVKPSTTVTPPVSLPSPVILSVSPSIVEAGQTVEITIAGRNFVGGCKLFFNPPSGIDVNWMKCSPSVITAGLSITGDAAPGARDITIQNPDKKSYTVGEIFSVKPSTAITPPVSLPSPVIVSVSPSIVEAGQTVEITVAGHNFVEGCQFFFNPPSGININWMKYSPTVITAGISIAGDAPPGARDMTLYNPDKQHYTATGVLTVKLPQPGRQQPAAPLLSIPVDAIIKANTLERYHIAIETSPAYTYSEGEVDTARQLLYLQIGFSVQNEPADYYIAGGKGYGRPVTSSKWLRVQAPEQFPDYLQWARGILQGQIASVIDDGQTWKVIIETKGLILPPRDKPDEFFESFFEEPQDAVAAEVMKQVKDACKDMQIALTLWIAQKDYRITKMAIETWNSNLRTDMTYTFSESKDKVSLPRSALKAPDTIFPVEVLLLRLKNIAGWMEGTHRLFAQQSIDLIEATDPGPVPRYSEIYNEAWGDLNPLYDPPGEGINPVLIGSHYEDSRYRPALYDDWLRVRSGALRAPFRDNYFRDYNHFGGHETGLLYELIFELRGAPPTILNDRYYSAKNWGYGGNRVNRALNGMTFTGAIGQYNRNTYEGRRNAYLMMGHVLHLFQDQAEPDHSRLVGHPGSSMTEGEAFDQYYICALWSAQAALAAITPCSILCASGCSATLIFYAGCVAICIPICVGAAAFAATVACYAWRVAEQNDVGYERLVRDVWNPAIEERVGDRIRDMGVIKPPDYTYDSYFADIADFSVAAADRMVLSSPLGLEPIPAIWLVGVYAPEVDPGIDKTDAGETGPYLRLTDEVGARAISLGAGLLEYFYEIVNPPPYIISIMVVEGGDELPVLRSGNAVPGEIRYHAHWVDKLDWISRYIGYEYLNYGYISGRTFRVEKDEPVRSGKQAYIYVELGPSVGPEKGKRAARIEMTIGEMNIPLTLHVSEDGRPYYSGRLPVFNCEETEQRLQVEITAYDGSAHLDSRTQPGYELDSNPKSVARVSSDTLAYPLTDYEPGPDRKHFIRFAPAVWRIDVSPDNSERPPVRIPETHSVILSVQSVVEGSESGGGVPVEMILPGTSCPVHWQLDEHVRKIDGRTPEEGSVTGYGFTKLLITAPEEAVTQLLIQPGVSTSAGTYSININYTVGRRSGNVPVIFEVTR